MVIEANHRYTEPRKRHEPINLAKPATSSAIFEGDIE
jgi:hypothetical protein